MSTISRRFRWLELLFPPGQATPPNPSFLTDEIYLVHPILSGTERLNEHLTITATGSSGGTTVTAGTPPADKYWYVFACSCFHTDPVAHQLRIDLLTSIGAALHASDRDVPQNANLAVPRPFIVPPRVSIRAVAAAMAGGTSLTLRLIHLELDFGEPPPPW